MCVVVGRVLVAKGVCKITLALCVRLRPRGLFVIFTVSRFMVLDDSESALVTAL